MSLEKGELTMATKEKCDVAHCGEDCITRGLKKVGICRSMLITLALIPFAWEGVAWVAGAINALWGLATNAVGV
tara:strand:- start:697 stop:918 length:222 start_codon:yes stop_codon:yes gene_type:complete